MVKTCSVKGCKNRFLLGSRLRFHLFPRNPSIRKKWISAIQRDNFNPTRYSCICSDHFKDIDYESQYEGSRLHKGAVPSINNFPDPGHFSIVTIKSEVADISEIKTEDDNIDCNINQDLLLTNVSNDSQHTFDFDNNDEPDETQDLCLDNSGKRKRRSYPGDFSREDMHNSSKARKFYDIIKQSMSESEKEIKSLLRTNRRLKSRIKTFKSLHHLKNSKRIN